MNKTKKVLSVILAMCMLLGMVPMGVLSFATTKDYYWPLDTKWSIKTRFTGSGTDNHTGVDMPADGGTPLYAVCDGTVTFYQVWTKINGVKTLTSYGNAAYLTPDSDASRQIRYAHLRAFNYATTVNLITATRDQSGNDGKDLIGKKHVAVGEIIGYVGTTGHSTGNHLHFEVRIGGTAKDPENYLDPSQSALQAATNAGQTTGFFSDSDLAGITVSAFVKNSNRAAYINRMLRYYLMNDSRVYRNLTRPSSTGNSRSAVFFFEGGSDNVDDGTLGNASNYRRAAVCVVIQMKDGKPYIAFHDEDSTTLPDNPRSSTQNEGKGIATIKDGIYSIYTVNHRGKSTTYAAFNVKKDGTVGVPAVRLTADSIVTQNSYFADGSTCYADYGTGINIHARYRNSIDTTTINSIGCLNVGVIDNTATKYTQYNRFVQVVSRQSINPIVGGYSSGSHQLFKSEGSDMGVVIVNRSLYKSAMRNIYKSSSGNDDANRIIESILTYTNEIESTMDVQSDLQTHSFYESPDICVQSAEPPYYQSFNKNEAINISWNAIENATSYTVRALVLDGDPGYLYYGENAEAGTTINLIKLSETSYQIPASYVTAGKALKVAVAANYEDGTSMWSACYPRVTPNAPVITSFADEATVTVGQDLTVTWSGATGAQEYEYKVIELEEKTPDRTSESEPARRTIIPLSRTSSESFTISGEDLPSGRAFKIWLSSIGKDNTHKGQAYYFYTDGVETNIPVIGIAFESETLAMTVGSTAIKRPVFTPKTATNKGLTYVSENPAVATVDADGIVTALAAGTTRITATAADGGYTASFTVSVITQQQSGDRWYHAYSPYYDKRITPELIQQFLESYGGSLKNTTTVDGETRVQAGATTFSLGFENYFELNIAGSDTKNGAGLSYAPLNTYASAKSMTPAEIIYHACMKNNFNVVYVLAKLQQEMSLITLDLTQSSGKTTPETRIRKAMGYLYATSDNGHNWGFYGQVLGATYNISTMYWDNCIRTMEDAYNTYTPPKVEGNMLYSTFLTNIYNPYAAKFDALLSGATVTSENVLLDDQSFKMEYPAQEESVISLSPLNVSWTSCEGADYYMISMRDVTEGEAEGKSNLLFSRQRVDDLEYTIAGSYFAKDHRYKIAVGAYYTTQSGKGYEKWITPYTYVTVSDSASLGRPAFISPVNNTQIAENTPITVHWAAASGANSYNINVRDLTTDTKIIDARDVGDATSYTIPVSENGSNLLVSGHRYRVAVEAKNYSGDSRWADPHLQFSVAGDVPQQDLAEHLMEVPAGFTGIYSSSDLQNVRDNLSGSYILMNDIDLSDIGNWAPIGTEISVDALDQAFKGVLNGNGYAIKNASVSSTSLNNVGLFGCNAGTIANLTVDIASSGNWRVGGLAGSNYGSIQNCTVNGAVRNNSSNFDESNGHGGSYAGGICGTNLGTIASCVSTAATVANGADVPNGSLAGQNWSGGLIQSSYATGNVWGGRAGGLVGSNNASYLEKDATIENCFALGNVNGNYAGGLVGQCLNYSTAYSGKAVIRNCYASNFVTGSQYAGGIVGYVACNYEVAECYYNSSISTCSDTDKGLPRNNTQMQSSSTFTGWAMGSVWNVASNVNNGYPYLRGLETTSRNLSGDSASDFTYKLTDGSKTIQITGYQGPRVDVTIPAMIERKPVTSIASYAFQYNTNIVSVSLPDTMLTLYSYAFFGCSKLQEVDLGNGVQTIQDGVFDGCVSIKSVFLPASLVFSVQNGSVTVAKEEKLYTAVFVVDGTAVSTKQYHEGEMIVKPADPTKEGYTFKGWTPSVPATMSAGDQTFTAKFEKNPQSTI